MEKKYDINLTKKEQEIMTVLWNAKKPLTSSEICDYAKNLHIDLNLSTVQMTINKLIKLDMIKVGEITQLHKTLARAFVPNISPDKLAVMRFKNTMNSLGKKNISGLVSTLLENEQFSDADYKELTEMIEEMRKK